MKSIILAGATTCVGLATTAAILHAFSRPTVRRILFAVVATVAALIFIALAVRESQADEIWWLDPATMEYKHKDFDGSKYDYVCGPDGCYLKANGATVQSPEVETTQAKQQASYVVRVQALDGNGVSSFGTGTLVDSNGERGLVVTNWHVVKDRQGDQHTVNVHFSNGKSAWATVLVQDGTVDLAALLINNPHANPATVADAEPGPNERVSIGGYGSSNTYSGPAGVLACRATQGQRLETMYWLNSQGSPVWCEVRGAAARQGDSGGPVFNAKGEYCGTLWGSNPPQSTTFVRLNTVRSFLGRVPVQYRPCPNGQCYGQPLVPVVRPKNPVVTQPPVSQPPIAQPPQPTVKSCECDQAKILALIAAIEQRNTKLEVLITELAARKPPAGQPGQTGPKGDAGPAGPAGAAGKDGVVDVQKIADEVEKRIKGNLRVVMETVP